MFEVLNYYRPAIQGSQIVRELGLEKYKYLLVSAHREENVDPEDEVLDLMQLPSTLGNRFDEPVVVSTHPRMVGDYAVPNVSDKVLRLILSYTDYVRRTVWHQY
jgi:UDP-N-acetylglucosamine 2-epimerase